jgi:hypothetical protein
MVNSPIRNLQRDPPSRPETLVQEIVSPLRFSRQWSHYKGLQQVAANLARYMLDVIPAPDGQGTLLTMILTAACSAADAVSRSVVRDRDRAIQTAFVSQVVRQLHHVVAARVRVQVGAHTMVWEPSQESLAELQERYRHNRLRVDKQPIFLIDDDTARLYLAARIVPLPLLAALGIPLIALLPESLMSRQDG